MKGSADQQAQLVAPTDGGGPDCALSSSLVFYDIYLQPQIMVLMFAECHAESILDVWYAVVLLHTVMLALTQSHRYATS